MVFRKGTYDPGRVPKAMDWSPVPYQYGPHTIRTDAVSNV